MGATEAGRYEGRGEAGGDEVRAQWTICLDTGFPARHGECVVHGGDACLVEVVLLKDLVKAQAELWAARERKPF